MKMKNRQKRLDARVRDFNALRSEGASSDGKTIWIKNGSGKNVAYRRPGSLSK